MIGGVVLVLAFGAWIAYSSLSSEEVQIVNETPEDEVVPNGLAPITLKEQTVSFEDGSEITYRIAEPFEITVAAEGLGKARFMALSPDGRIFVPDIVNYNLSHQGELHVLGGFDEETGRFTEHHTYLSGLRGPNSVAFYTDDEGKHWLYLALTAHLVRYPYTPGDVKPSGKGEIVTTFPNTQTPGEKSVVWHITRTLHFEDDRLYISIGSGCNSCEQPAKELRGMVMVMNPDGSDAHMYADGLRNSVGLEFAEGSLYVTNNGVDHLGNEPYETMFKIEEGKHYGWPYCYQGENGPEPDTTGMWSREYSCEDAPHPLTTFDSRSAPLGLRFFENAHAVLEGAFLVALHGSFDVTTGTGNQVRRVALDGTNELFMDGFLSEDGERLGRPVDFLQHDENSFFMTDDHAGVIYFVRARE
jgi:glucose/arabinose dehydrogenase